MFCINCGKKIADDSKFCPFCGTQCLVIENPVNTANIPSSILSKKESINYIHLLTNILPLLMVLFVMLGGIFPVVADNYALGETAHYNFFHYFNNLQSFIDQKETETVVITLLALITIFVCFISGLLYVRDLLSQNIDYFNIVFSMINGEGFAICMWIISKLTDCSFTALGWALLVVPIFNIFVSLYIKKVQTTVIIDEEMNKQTTEKRKFSSNTFVFLFCLILVFGGIWYFYSNFGYEKLFKEYMNQMCDMEFAQLLDFYPEKIQHTVLTNFESSHCDITEYSSNMYWGIVSSTGDYPSVSYKIRNREKCSYHSIRGWEKYLYRIYGQKYTILSAFSITTQISIANAPSITTTTTFACINGKWYVIDGYLNH